GVMKQIEVTVLPDGSIQIDAVGFKGSDCEQATRFLEEALGVVAAKQKKPEFHQQNITKTQQRIGS
ncbi:MAG: DUF2997 domain-containing protein, partial [Limisphaerales bacterium]